MTFSSEEAVKKSFLLILSYYDFSLVIGERCGKRESFL